MKYIFSIIILLMQIPHLFAQKNTTLLSHVPFPYLLSNVWGYEQDDRRYALVGTQFGMTIVDITNPSLPEVLMNIPGSESIWREIKTWQHYAYVTTEGGGGLTIVDLSGLPDFVSYTSTTFGDYHVNSIHALHIDEFGIAYLYGSNYSAKGAFAIDVHTDPMHPTYVGFYDTRYVHDGQVKNKILYAGEILNGTCSIVDVSDWNNVNIIASFETPNAFTHNTWLSDDNKTLYTSDERSGAYITSYNIENINNITELDRWQNAFETSTIPHNVIVNNDYLVVGYYKDGVYLVDAHKPDNLVTLGYYDTSPLPSGSGFGGCWGAYPFSSSNIILASDIQEGLYILEANYTRACYLEGNVKDSLGNIIIGASVQILNDTITNVSFTGIDGNYKTGYVDSGYVSVLITYPDCSSDTVHNIYLDKGIVTNYNFISPCLSTFTNIQDHLSSDAILCFNSSTLVEIKAPFHNFTLSLFDLQGKLVLKKSTDNNSISIDKEQLNNAIYIASITHKNQQIFKKISIQ